MRLTTILTALTFLVLLWSCGQKVTSGVLISGQIDNAAGLEMFLDKSTIGGANNILTKAAIDDSGNFALSFPDGLEPGIYQLRVGAQRAAIALNGQDGEISIDGELSTFGRYGFTIDGSKEAESMVATFKQLSQMRPSIDDIKAIVDTASNPQVGAYIAFQTLARVGEQGLPVHKAALARMAENDPMAINYRKYVNSLEAQIAQRRSAEKIKVGQPAPEIALPNPSGQVYRLSDLQGKVVLLDFWASWCGPCRRENPNVVKVYDKYKEDGFTIYSVSLDGIDPRRSGGMSVEQLAQANEGQRNRWVGAIEKDGLTWPYHVSELKKWSGQVSAEYGVTGIPKTFLIDREGNIAAVGLRGAAQIEQALQRVL